MDYSALVFGPLNIIISCTLGDCGIVWFGADFWQAIHLMVDCVAASPVTRQSVGSDSGRLGELEGGWGLGGLRGVLIKFSSHFADYQIDDAFHKLTET